MYCPVCGQQQVSTATRFCSRCGFLLAGIAKVISHGGVIPGMTAGESKSSPRKRGLKQGLFIFLLSFLFVPLIGMISVALRIPPFAVGFAAILFTMGGLLRMAYALMFESAAPGAQTLEENLLQTSHARPLPQSTPDALPPQQEIPASSYVSPSAGKWRDTNDLIPSEPGSVTDSTTKLLQDRDTQ